MCAFVSVLACALVCVFCAFVSFVCVCVRVLACLFVCLFVCLCLRSRASQTQGAEYVESFIDIPPGYIYIYIYICIYVYTYIYIYTNMYICILICTHYTLYINIPFCGSAGFTLSSLRHFGRHLHDGKAM